MSMSTKRNNNQTPEQGKRLALGTIVATPGASEACADGLVDDCLDRHRKWDWGIVDDEDWETNNSQARRNGQVLSAYTIDEGLPGKNWGANCLWVITEGNRSVTTVLLPSEY